MEISNFKAPINESLAFLYGDYKTAAVPAYLLK